MPTSPDQETRRERVFDVEAGVLARLTAEVDAAPQALTRQSISSFRPQITTSTGEDARGHITVCRRQFYFFSSATHSPAAIFSRSGGITM